MVNLDMRLSANFHLGEFLRSATAERHDEIREEQFSPPENVIENLSYLCKTVLQPVRDKLGVPMKITSGYRCPSLNKLVKGSSSSQHMFGQAADVQMSAKLLHQSKHDYVRNKIRQRVEAITNKKLRDDINANFYLFSYICIQREKLDVDQVIHEFGEKQGRPGWVHISSSSDDRDKQQMLAIGGYLPNRKETLDLEQALKYGT